MASASCHNAAAHRRERTLARLVLGHSAGLLLVTHLTEGLLGGISNVCHVWGSEIRMESCGLLSSPQHPQDLQGCPECGCRSNMDAKWWRSLEAERGSAGLLNILFVCFNNSSKVKEAGETRGSSSNCSHHSLQCPAGSDGEVWLSRCGSLEVCGSGPYQQ